MPTDLEIEARVGTIYSLLLDGCSPREIFRFVAEKTDWGVCSRTVDNYIARARDEFRARATPCRDEEFGKAMERLTNLYRKTMTIQDYKACLAVQKEINELLGLAAPKKLDLKAEVKIEDVREKLIAELDALADRATTGGPDSESNPE